MKKIIASIFSFLIIINVFVPVNAEQATANTSKFSNQQISKKVSSDNLKRVVCFKNKLYIAVGANGTIRTSPDGLKWTTNSKVFQNTSSELHDIVCTENQIIVVGAKGTILRSTNGADWKTVKSTTSNTINKVIYGKNTFVAFTDIQGEILISKDGIVWKYGKVASKNKIYDTAFNDKVFVTVGDMGEISTSSNGLYWKTQTLKNQPSFKKVLWNGKMFIAFGTTSNDTEMYTATSKDGYSWTVNSFNMGYTKNLEAYSSYNPNIAWTGKEFVITLIEAYNSDYPFHLTTFKSKNGLDWKRYSFGIKNGLIPSLINLVWNGKAFLSICNYSSYNGLNTYSPQIYTSKDGVNWKIKNIDNANSEDCGRVSDVIYNNGIIITIGERGIIRSSKDGVNWSK